MSRVAVYGAGAVGGYLAWQFAKAGHAVCVIARGEQLAAIRAGGIVLDIHGRQAESVAVAATDDPRTLDAQDMVIVTLKHPGLAAAVDGLGHLAAAGAPFVFANNGVPWWTEPRLDILDPGGRLAGAIAPAARVGCVVKASIEVRTPGIVSMDTPSARFILGPASSDAEDAAKATLALFEQAGIRTTLEPDLRPAVWDKLLLNLGLGLPAAVLDLPVGTSISQPDIAPLLKELLGEIRSIARAGGVATTIADDVLGDASILSSPHLPSLLQDLRRGRPAEIDALVTAPLLIARQAGVAVPALERLGALVTAKARALGCYEGPAGHG
jgi:2-dehydropantoate 2-reductase